MTTKKLCTRCLKHKPEIAFYFTRRPRRASWCVECVKAAQREKSNAARVRGDFWYQEASGNKSPLPFSFSVRFDTRAWRKLGKTYVIALTIYAQWLKDVQKNRRAASVVDRHLKSIPEHMPYIVEVMGDEWPIIASALLKCKRHGKGQFARDVQNLYTRFGKKRTEAKHDYDPG